ncbi:uncharacterized protein C53C9.2-like [Ruditapes philippinarum]|uniref:uncharacterized protein C53C9.2-like n=1 Tax=Ruditapes philippinarum TaxID=129788 RepID=UPI00295C05C5|nr:uncharacterized protein C53C9.2-like [Ruditapes philippinarum]
MYITMYNGIFLSFIPIYYQFTLIHTAPNLRNKCHLRHRQEQTKWEIGIQLLSYCLITEMETEKKPKRKFSRKQLRASQGMLTMQAKTNIYSSQTGMTCFGAVRHGSDIRADNACPEGQGELTQTAKTNVFASQKGMTCFGSVRHGPDIRSDDASSEGLSTLTLQTGTNQFASQSGMTCFGSVRHGPDIPVTELYDEGNDDEYPTDEDEPVTIKPARKLREEIHEVNEPQQRNGEIERSPEPEVKREKTPEVVAEDVISDETEEPKETTEETKEEEETEQQDDMEADEPIPDKE